MDGNMKFSQPGLPVFLRIKNAVDAPATVPEYVEFGFQWEPSGVPLTGVTDVKINPPPSVEPVSMHNIGLNSARLQFGAHKFMISHTFVLQRMQEKGYTDPYQVFRSDEVIGLYHNNRLFSMESIVPHATGSSVIYWDIIANVQEPKTVDA